MQPDTVVSHSRSIKQFKVQAVAVELTCQRLDVVVGGLGIRLTTAAKRVRGCGAAELQDAVPGVRCPEGEGEVEVPAPSSEEAGGARGQMK